MNIVLISIPNFILFGIYYYYFENKLKNIKSNYDQLTNKMNDCNDILMDKINNNTKLINDMYSKEYVENFKYSHDRLLLIDKIDILNKDIQIINVSFKKLIDSYNTHKHNDIVVNKKGNNKVTDSSVFPKIK